VAVVTGATTGVGRVLASGLARAGASLVLVGPAFEAEEEQIKHYAAQKVAATFVRADVTTIEGAQRVLDAARDAFGRVDILVNNANACADTRALSLRPGDWRWAADVSQNALWNCLHVLGWHLVESERGTIVNVASTSDIEIHPSQRPSFGNASKAAVTQLTSTFAKEWSSYGVRVNGLVPGADTLLHGDWHVERAQPAEATIEELVPVVNFLASDASILITGSNLQAADGRMF
jgi:NAD(P)-dependent dehydrogenase (short-subunit alcohol dehydrogenase family)